MQLVRVQAILLRHLRATFRDLMRVSDLFYWPLIDILIWGFTSQWIKPEQAGSSSVTLVLLTSLVLLQVSHRATMDVSFNLLDELWSRNIVNIFATPLRFSEWVLSGMVMGFLKSFVTIFFGAFLVYAFYGVNIFVTGLFFILAALSVLISGWTLGFIASGLIIYFGQRVQSLTWMITWFFVPLSAVFYFLSVLPRWMQILGKSFPMTYIFESVRIYVHTNIFPWGLMGLSFALNIFYVVLLFYFYKIMFTKSLSHGLAHLEHD